MNDDIYIQSDHRKRQAANHRAFRAHGSRCRRFAFGRTLPVSAQRLTGTALGVYAGAVAGTYYPGNALVFGARILILGIVFVPFRLEPLAMIMLVPGHSGRIVALHRFFEVSVGIAVGLAFSAVWPER